MHNKILIPLDGTRESEQALQPAARELAADGEAILLKVVLPAKAQTIGTQVIPGEQIDEIELSKAISYLKTLTNQLDGRPYRWRYETIIARSVPEGILDVASRENVDLIVMCSHDRKGLSRLMKKSVSKDVERKARVDVKVFKPGELMVAG